LPTPAGSQYVEVVTDLFTKYVLLRAVKSAKAEESALTLRLWTSKNGAPTKMLTDRGTNYTSEVLLVTARLFNVQKLFTTPGHKETNGQAERLVKTVVGMMVASWQQDLQWDENLDLYE
jgi:transposase InsO family protein